MVQISLAEISAKLARRSRKFSDAEKLRGGSVNAPYPLHPANYPILGIGAPSRGTLSLSQLLFVPRVAASISITRKERVITSDFICVTCGMQYPPAEHPPERCPICEDPRQFVGPSGQEWTSLERLRKTHRNVFHKEGMNLWGIGTDPKFGIGQRALLVQRPGGNILFDCVSLIDSDTVALVNSLGGLTAIAVSHPHFYSSIVEWSHAFGNVPVFLHEDDRMWVQRSDRCIHFWQGEAKSLGGGITLIRLGGHFPGFQVMHWAAGEGGDGVLMSADLPQVCADRKNVSFMYSYPNFIPLDVGTVRRIVAALEPFRFAKVYGGWFGLAVEGDGENAIRRSAERYIGRLQNPPPP